jgi:hypothetical protein
MSPPEKAATVSSRSAVVAALSLLSASMGLSLSDTGPNEPQKGDTGSNIIVANKAKTADKSQALTDEYIKAAKPSKTGPTASPKPTTGRSKK